MSGNNLVKSYTAFVHDNNRLSGSQMIIRYLYQLAMNTI